MRAVWSFWSKPHTTAYLRRPWRSEFHHALSWMLSVQEASKHYPDTWLYTDDEGARFLADGLQLPFAHVSTELNALRGNDPQWWVLGKIYTYSLQTAPFVHLDSDVFLWLPLPERLGRSDVFAHARDGFVAEKGYVRPDHLDEPLEAARGWLPDEWRWYRSTRTPRWHAWTDIYGGCRLDFIHHVAESALRLVNHPANDAVFSRMAGKQSMTNVLEEFMLVAHIEYHAQRRDSPFQGIKPAFLFDSAVDATNPRTSADMGFSHMWAGLKAMQSVTDLLEHRVRTDYPAQYKQCRRVGRDGAFNATS